MSILSNFPTGNGNGNTGILLDAVSSIKTLTASEKVYVKWTDPEDIFYNDIGLAVWAGTLLVRKAGSAPLSRRDGTIVLDIKVRNAYKDTYFCDSGLSNNTTYYYKFFPYTEGKKYTEDVANEFSAIPSPIGVGDITNISAVAKGSGSINLTWTDPAASVVEDGVTLATWAKTQVIYRTDRYPTSTSDGTLAVNSTVRNAYSTTPYTVIGLTNGVTYYFGFFPISSDGVVNTNTASGATAKPDYIKITATPTQRGTLTYTGGTQSPSWNNYNTTQMTIGGTTSALDAGTYTATFTPTSAYAWSDGTRTPLEVEWTIGRASISTTPSQSNTLAYTGATLSPTWSNYSTNQMTIGGTTSAINAGTYDATFTPNGNYKWADGTTTAKTVSWEISKATGSLSISPTSMTLDTTTKSKTITVTRAGDGKITATSNSTSVATVSVSGNIVTVTGVASGSATITISVAEGANHTAPSNKTCSVTASFLPAKKALNETSWAEISQVSAANQGANYWAVGDCKAITISGTIEFMSISSQTVYVYILGFNHNQDIEGTGIHFGCFKTALTSGKDICIYDPEDSLSFTIVTSEVMVRAGWNGSYAYSSLLGGYDGSNPTNPNSSTFMSILPSDLRAVLKPMRKYFCTSDTSASCVDEYLTLLSCYEIFANGSNSRNYSPSIASSYQKQYDYYVAGNSARKNDHIGKTSSARYWTRTVDFEYGDGYVLVSATRASSDDYEGTAGLAPIFMV